MTNESEREKPDLGVSGADVTAAFARSFLSIVPVLGQALQEVVTALVPNQRTERFEKYLLFLLQELELLKVSVEALKKPENIDLIEDGAYQAVRALTDERKRLIAKAVAHGIASEEQSKIDQKRILNIVGDLDDEEIMILKAHASPHQDASLQKIMPRPVTGATPRHEAERAAFFDWSIAKLRRLSLLGTTQLGNHNSFEYVTAIGRAVLRAIDLLPPDKG
jgi:hypothetical protein